MEIVDSGVTLINISPARGMVNNLEIFGEVNLWIPNGMGFYPASKLKLILEQESNQPNLGKMIAFIILVFGPIGWRLAGIGKQISGCGRIWVL